MNPPDLTKQPPRSPRVRLGGYVILPRILDKCRAVLAGTQGDYKFACSVDQRFFSYVGIEPEAFKTQVAQGKGDSEMLAWIRAAARPARCAAEIAAWSAYQEATVPGTPDARDFFQRLHTQIAPGRDDITTWFDLLDLDDFVSFGGSP